MKRAIGRVRAEVLASRMRIALSADVRALLANTRMPLVDLRARHDRLIATRQREGIIAARPDAFTADIDGPHALLFTRAGEAWRAVTRYPEFAPWS